MVVTARTAIIIDHLIVFTGCTPFNTWLSVPTRVCCLNSISISSAIFAQLIMLINMCTYTHRHLKQQPASSIGAGDVG